MNELIEITKSLANCNQNEVAKQMMTVFRAVTPQFYKAMTDSELKAELLSIKLLTQDIDQPTLAEMCRIAVSQYATSRSTNSRIYFDMNYLLMFYVQAFNNVHCFNVEIPKKSRIIENDFNYETKKITEIWETPSGEKICIQFIESDFTKRVHYSPKFNENAYTDINDL